MRRTHDPDPLAFHRSDKAKGDGPAHEMPRQFETTKPLPFRIRADLNDPRLMQSRSRTMTKFRAPQQSPHGHAQPADPHIQKRFESPTKKLPSKPSLPDSLREGLRELFPTPFGEDMPDEFQKLLQQIDPK